MEQKKKDHTKLLDRLLALEDEHPGAADLPVGNPQFAARMMRKAMTGRESAPPLGRAKTNPKAKPKKALSA